MSQKYFEDSIIDLFAAKFWLATFAAMIVLATIRSPRLRPWAWAGINIGFVALLIGPWALAVAAAAGAFHVLLKLIERGRLTTAATAFGGATVAMLFLAHKLPGAIAEVLPNTVLTPILTAVGFSYVALRMVDALLSVSEHRQLAIDLPGTINYLIPFHMLSAGPILAYDEFVTRQPAVPEPPGPALALGAAERIATGMFKKFVLAYAIEKTFLTGFNATGWYFVLEIQLYAIWIYLDFSAYTDIAVGIGRLIGSDTPENFDRPFLSRNIIEIWNRWHMSLSAFVRRNIFIPIQMSLMRRTEGRHPLLIASFAFTTTFLILGLWHEVNWRYLVFGALQALGLIVCNLYKHLLAKRLGRKGVQAYLANPWIRVIAVLMTFEYFACTLIVTGYRNYMNG
jgi:D-alanyl-lipoteichoic acid acyltransferase DltB (MBOAT superfamily)